MRQTSDWPIADAFSVEPRIGAPREVRSIARIPSNFYKNIFVLDFGVSPQVVPGSEELSDSHLTGVPGLAAYDIINGIIILFKNLFRFALKDIPTVVLNKNFNRTRAVVIGLFGSVILVISISIVGCIMLATALSFRYAVKSTALVWLPLLWIIYQSKPGAKILDRIYITVSQPWYKLMLIYSTFVIIGAAIKVALVLGIWRLMQLDRLGILGILMTRLVAPFEMPLWQIASAINACLAWVFFFRAKRHLLARNSSEAWPEGWIEQEYVIFQAVRTTFSFYAIACTLYIAAATAWQTSWPPVHFILFPRIASPRP